MNKKIEKNVFWGKNKNRKEKVKTKEEKEKIKYYESGKGKN